MLIDWGLALVSFIAGIWNVLHEKFVSIQRSLCVFILGSSFCYGTAKIAAYYGFDSETATVVGYLAGIMSPSIYNMFVQIIAKIPEIFEKKIGGGRGR